MSEQHDYDGISYREEQHSPNIFRILFAGLLIWGVIFLGYYLFGGWSSPKEFDEKTKTRESAQQQTNAAAPTSAGAAAVTADQAKQLYNANCAACHGDSGKGVAGVGPDLSVATYKYGKDKTNVVKSIMEGRSGGMPGFSGQLTPPQIAALADYLIAVK